jgi:hypothetical protein
MSIEDGTWKHRPAPGDHDEYGQPIPGAQGRQFRINGEWRSDDVAQQIADIELATYTKRDTVKRTLSQDDHAGVLGEGVTPLEAAIIIAEKRQARRRSSVAAATRRWRARQASDAALNEYAALATDVANEVPGAIERLRDLLAGKARRRKRPDYVTPEAFDDIFVPWHYPQGGTMPRNVDPILAIARSRYGNACRRANQTGDPSAMLDAAAEHAQYVSTRRVVRLRRLSAELVSELSAA